MKKVAIIHDWLNGMRGGEKVLECILELFPEADIFTLFFEPSQISEKIKAHQIFPSPLNKYKFIRKRYRHFLPLFPRNIEEFNLKEYDLIISSSHCVAKGIIPFPQARHISYIHSPMRYIWDQYYTYFQSTNWLKKMFIRKQMSKLRTWDVASSDRVDHFVANSNFVRQRIWKYYRREAVVIHPPIDTDFFLPLENPRRDYFLTVSALVPYKQNELLIKTFNQLEEKLLIVGRGSEERRLKQMAGENIEFRKDVTGEELRTLYQNARAFIFAGVEDFGMSFVEAQACGTPIIAYNKGGILDIVQDDSTGILFNGQSEKDIINAINILKNREKDDPSRFNIEKIRENSLRFSRKIFLRNFKEFLREIP
jgi:glycosyltransferase involved in cell wall biosynthesis